MFQLANILASISRFQPPLCTYKIAREDVFIVQRSSTVQTNEPNVTLHCPPSIGLGHTKVSEAVTHRVHSRFNVLQKRLQDHSKVFLSIVSSRRLDELLQPLLVVDETHEEDTRRAHLLLR